MNAIILAAGMGTRLRPLTDSVPKALVKVNGESFFERQLRLLSDCGIKDITVITGYKAEAFDPWRSVPGLNFVHNPRFDCWNNFYSMFLARQFLGNTIVLDGDVWISDGILPGAEPDTSRWYVGYRDSPAREWAVVCDESGRVIDIEVRSGKGWILTGISYWTANDGAYLARFMESMMAGPDFKDLYWDDAPRFSLDRLRIHAEQLPPGAWTEVDTVAELESLRSSV